MQMRKLICILTVMLALLPFHPASAAPQTEISGGQVVFSFPETVTFSAKLSADQAITSVVLEYGNEQQTCGEVLAKAYPVFTPAKKIDVEWTWDMRQSGSLPPGSSLWWRWRFVDESGREYLSETQTATWLDDVHDWQVLSAGDLNLHWYEGSRADAQSLLDAGLQSLKWNQEQAGLVTDSPIHIYVYASYDDLRDAILFEPSWMGGSAYAEHNIVLAGLSGGDVEYDRNVIIHEITHVLIGHFTFSCLNDMPSWLEEGLAVYSEGKLDEDSQQQLDDAVAGNELLSVRSLSSGFSEEYSKATLSYSQSYSIVKFLIETHGQKGMTRLLEILRDGSAIDPALQQVYGFDLDGLEDAWRESIGAAPRPVQAQPTMMPTPTHVPTIVPMAGGSLLVTPTPYQIPTSTGSTGQAGSSGPPLWLTLSLLGFCCVFGILIGVIVLGVVVRMSNSKVVKHDQK